MRTWLEREHCSIEPLEEPMSLRRFTVKLLDRPGGRGLLAAGATWYAKRLTGIDVRVLHREGLWTRRVGPYYFPDSSRFEYFADSFEKGIRQAEKYISDAKDYWFRFYQPRVGDVVIDVGAGQGEDALAFSDAVGVAGRVLAIEAHPGTFELLDAFCRLNGLSNTKPLWLALMGTTGNVSMTQSAHWERQSIDWTQQADQQVPATTLDDVCQREDIDDIAFLKMNIEGAEKDALAGMQNSIDYVRRICVACHDFRAERGDGEHFRTRSFVEDYLQSHGFSLAYRRDDRRDYVRDHVYGHRSG
jgi:FkbM family methyltransferase